MNMENINVVLTIRVRIFPVGGWNKYVMCFVRPTMKSLP